MSKNKASDTDHKKYQPFALKNIFVKKGPDP